MFEILGRKGEVAATGCRLRDRFVEGLAAYRTGDGPSRAEAFAACLALRPEDRPARMFLQRLETVA